VLLLRSIALREKEHSDGSKTKDASYALTAT